MNRVVANNELADKKFNVFGLSPVRIHLPSLRARSYAETIRKGKTSKK